MPRARNEIEASLKRKGFRLRQAAKSQGRRNNDHRYYDLWVDGKLTGVSTHVSTGSKYKSLGDPLLAKMAKQLKLTKPDFQNLIKCPLELTEYISKLCDAGIQIK